MDGHERTLLWVTAVYVFIDALRNITDRLISLLGTM
jgi:hypothetical protein